MYQPVYHKVDRSTKSGLSYRSECGTAERRKQRNRQLRTENWAENREQRTENKGRNLEPQNRYTAQLFGYGYGTHIFKRADGGLVRLSADARPAGRSSQSGVGSRHGAVGGRF